MTPEEFEDAVERIVVMIMRDRYEEKRMNLQEWKNYLRRELWDDAFISCEDIYSDREETSG